MSLRRYRWGHLLLLILLAAVINFSLQQSQEVLCDNAVVTSFSSNTATSSAYGILFTVSSTNNERVEITSLGFYVDKNELGSGDVVTYEVWTRQGHYADPDRTNAGNGGLPLNETFDYRGKFEYWSIVAVGTFNVLNVQQNNFFQVPFDRFTNTFITGGEVQSFYISLKEVGALMQAPLENWENFLDKQLTVHCLDNGDGTSSCRQNDSAGKKQPNIHIGEVVVSYPFYTVPYFYYPKKFMGTIYYIDECSTHSPTVDPTRSLSDRPTFAIE